MPPPDRPRGDVTGKLTVAAVVAAIACCGIPLLVAAGLLTSTGVALRNLALVGLGAALAAWLVIRVARRVRTQQRRDARNLHD